MLHCPKDHVLLERVGLAGAFVWVCPRCDGRAATMAVLRRQLDPPTARELWRQAFAAPATSLACPTCLQPTAEIQLTAAGARVELDVCRACACVWFDAGERQQLPDVPPPQPPLDRRPLELRQQLAIAEVKAMAQRAREEAEANPDLTLSNLPAVLGLPVELGAETERASRPWLTWSTAAIVAAVSIAGFQQPQMVRALALVPNQLGESFGLTLLSAFFVHAGWMHLLGNLWFLVAFGDDVEQRFGRARWLAILAGATVLGGLAHALFAARGEVPCVGASGGISGLIVCYALLVPKARLGMVLWIGVHARWLTFSARTALWLWLALQAWVLLEQMAGIGNVSALAHLGGAAAGAAFWLAWREPPVPHGLRSPPSASFR